MGLIDGIQTVFARPRPRQATITLGDTVTSTDVLDIVTPKQDQARTLSERIGMIREAEDTAATLGSSCPLRIEYRQSDGTWAPAQDPSDRDAAAEAALDLYRPVEGTQRDLVYREMYLRGRIGECWRIQVPAPLGGPPRWVVVDPIAVQRSRGHDGFVVHRLPGGSVAKGTAYNVTRDRVQRVWTAAADWELHATSPIFGVLHECNSLVIGDRNAQKRMLSRVVAGKLLVTPELAHKELTDPRPGGPATNIDKAYTDWANSHAKEDADYSVAALAPLHLWWDLKTEGPPHVIDLGDDLDPGWIPFRDELLHSIARGLPWPTQLIMDGPGGSSNHWGDWKADDKATQRIAADLSDVCEGITVGQFRPTFAMLVEARLSSRDPDDVRVGFDVGPLKAEVDNSAKVLGLHDRGIVGPDTVIEHTPGVSASDRATEEERAGIVEFMRAMKAQPDTPAGVSVSREEGAPGELTRAAAIAEPVRERIVVQPIDDAAVTRIAAAVAAAIPPPIPTPVDPPAPMVASTSRRWQNFTAAMRSEDERFRSLLALAMSTAMRDALTRAGARVERAAERKAASVKDAVTVAQTAGYYPRSLLAAVGVDDQQLLGRRFDDLTVTAVALLAEHQRRRRRLVAQQVAQVDDSVWEPVEEERQSALAAWLAVAMTAAALSRLTRADDTGQRGEVPVDPLVPGDVLASVVRISNGAQVRDGTVETPIPTAAQEPAVPAGLVDPLITETVADAGGVVLYSWNYGDPATRHQPFEPHLNLDGRVWEPGEEAAVLFNAEPFPESEFFYPGDHENCACAVDSMFTDGTTSSEGSDL